MTAFKAQAHALKLQEMLSALFPSATYTTAYDASMNPTIKIVNAGETIFVNIQPVSNAGRVDGLGLSQTSYSPHQITILQEPSANGTDFNTRYTVLACAFFTGIKTFVYEIDPLPANYTLAGATLVSTIYPDPRNKLTNAQ